MNIQSLTIVLLFQAWREDNGIDKEYPINPTSEDLEEIFFRFRLYYFAKHPYSYVVKNWPKPTQAQNRKWCLQLVGDEQPESVTK